MYTLYLLARTDLASMTAGRVAAQCSHASNAFVEYMKGTMCETEQALECERLCNIWQGFRNENDDDTYNQSGLGFGTVIVLAATGAEMYFSVNTAKIAGLHAGIVNDPTYPVRDGEVTYIISLDTVGWIFGDKEDPRIKVILGDFKLYP